MFFLGYDVGSSSVKVSVLDGNTGDAIVTVSYPEKEMPISVPHPDWAEQNPEEWWLNLIKATRLSLENSSVRPDSIGAIGISYQMHGLVLIDKNSHVLRPSIIWCDSRAVEIGNHAFSDIGSEKCLSHLLNSPGNFTASKLAWVKENEPHIYARVWKFLLPGDYIAMKMTGEINTTVSGLSEGIFWDYGENDISSLILDYFGFDRDIFPVVVPTFGLQGKLTGEAAGTLGLKPGIPVSYRAGDQPNNAFSLNVLNPGELAATAGTSGVVYGVSDQRKYDPLSRINTFAHVNHQPPENRYGVLLCINGTGILNAWIRRITGAEGMSYDSMNREAMETETCAEGVRILPFGNGAERILSNRNIGAHISGLNFNIHNRKHLFRAAQEGIAFAFRYGIDILHDTGIIPRVIRAGYTNMFLSPLFSEAVTNLSGARIELLSTDGSLGAARAAGYGTGFYKTFKETFRNLKQVKMFEPRPDLQEKYEIAYGEWKKLLDRFLGNI